MVLERGVPPRQLIVVQDGDGKLLPLGGELHHLVLGADERGVVPGGGVEQGLVALVVDPVEGGDEVVVGVVHEHAVQVGEQLRGIVADLRGLGDGALDHGRDERRGHAVARDIAQEDPDLSSRGS